MNRQRRIHIATGLRKADKTVQLSGQRPQARIGRARRFIKGHAHAPESAARDGRRIGGRVPDEIEGKAIPDPDDLDGCGPRGAGPGLAGQTSQAQGRQDDTAGQVWGHVSSPG